MHTLFNLLTREQRKQASYLTEFSFIHMKELYNLIIEYSEYDTTREELEESANIAIEDFRESLRTRYNRHYTELSSVKKNYESKSYECLVDRIERMFLYYIVDKDRDKILEYLKNGQVDLEKLYKSWQEDCRQNPLEVIEKSLHRVDAEDYKKICVDVDRYENILSSIKDVVFSSNAINKKISDVSEIISYY